MIFVKNLVRKKNFKNYIISFSFMILGIFLFIGLLQKNENEYKETINQEIYRTIIVDKKINLKEEYIENILEDDEGIKIIVKDYSDRDKLIAILNEQNIDFIVNNPEDANNVLFYGIRFSIVLVFIFLIVILTIYIVQFIDDDLHMLRLMKIIGYKKWDLIKKYFISFNFIFNLLYIFSLVILFIFNWFIMHNKFVSYSFILYFYLFFNMLTLILIYYKIKKAYN